MKLANESGGTLKFAEIENYYSSKNFSHSLYYNSTKFGWFFTAIKASMDSRGVLNSTHLIQ